MADDEVALLDEGVLVLDDDGAGLGLDEPEAELLFSLTGGLDTATVSACPDCRSRVLAVVALVDLLDASAPHPRGPELTELADDAPTLHLYLVDRSTSCDHGRWIDPGYGEWVEVAGNDFPQARH
ncbi:MAG: hypothetical protein U0V73_06775 [Acidimicrobiia bacterium]